MSCDCAIRPQPMWPTRTRLLGASAPNRREGIISGAAAATVAVRMKSRRENAKEGFLGMFMLTLCTGRMFMPRRKPFGRGLSIRLLLLVVVLVLVLGLVGDFEDEDDDENEEDDDFDPFSHRL